MREGGSQREKRRDGERDGERQKDGDRDREREAERERCSFEVRRGGFYQLGVWDMGFTARAHEVCLREFEDGLQEVPGGSGKVAHRALLPRQIDDPLWSSGQHSLQTVGAGAAAGTWGPQEGLWGEEGCGQGKRVHVTLPLPKLP